jgi:hypothetical protein
MQNVFSHLTRNDQATIPYLYYNILSRIHRPKQQDLGEITPLDQHTVLQLLPNLRWSP